MEPERESWKGRWKKRAINGAEHERVLLSCAFNGFASLEDAAAASRTTDLACARWTRRAEETAASGCARQVRSTAIRMRLGRGTRPGSKPAQPGREAPTLTGPHDTRRGHGKSSSRRKSATNAVRRRRLSILSDDFRSFSLFLAAKEKKNATLPHNSLTGAHRVPQ